MRFFDLTLALLGTTIFMPLIVTIFVITSIFQSGRPLFQQERVGRDKKLFKLFKFRTMKLETRSVGTHEVNPSQVTAWGKILRRTKIDELPQLWNVLKGEMSLVGPRPCLPSQTQLIEARRKLAVFIVRPGITGLGQTRGIDMSSPELLANTDSELIRTLNLWNYFKYILLTVCGWGRGDRVRPQAD